VHLAYFIIRNVPEIFETKEICKILNGRIINVDDFSMCNWGSFTDRDLNFPIFTGKYQPLLTYGKSLDKSVLLVVIGAQWLHCQTNFRLLHNEEL
jgi:hypothetical protein